MLLGFYFILIALAGTIDLTVDAHTALRQYYLRQDMLDGFKANEHSVYDPSGKRLHYRVESRYSSAQTLELVIHPAKQIIGRLKSKRNRKFYFADLSILDAKTNRWTNGTMKHEYQLPGDVFAIVYDEKHNITFKHEFGTQIWHFSDGATDDVLAQYRVRPVPVRWTHKYGMDVFSDKYPEGIYILALSARDDIRKGKGGRG